MIRRDHPRLSLSRQCRLLSVSRSSLYHRPKGENAQNLGLMRRIDELFLEYPFYGSRQMVRHLWRDGICVGRHRVRRLMRLMRVQAIYQAPRTTTRHPEHRVYPYLLKGLAIERPNQVWSTDITYIPVQRGFPYLGAIMDWAPAACSPGGSPTPWMPGSASRPWLKPWTATAGPRSSTPTKAVNSPASSSPLCSKTPASPSPWTAGAAAWTTSSSSASGAHSSTRPSTCTSSQTASPPKRRLPSGSTSITPRGLILPSLAPPQPRPRARLRSLRSLRPTRDA